MVYSRHAENIHTHRGGRVLRRAGRDRQAGEYGRDPRQPRHGPRPVPLLEQAVGLRATPGARRHTRLVPGRLHHLLPPALVPPGAAGGTVPLGSLRQLRRSVDRGRQADRLPRDLLRVALHLRDAGVGQGRRRQGLVLQDEDGQNIREGSAGCGDRHLGTRLRRSRVPQEARKFPQGHGAPLRRQALRGVHGHRDDRHVGRGAHPRLRTRDEGAGTRPRGGVPRPLRPAPPHLPAHDAPVHRRPGWLVRPAPRRRSPADETRR